MAKASDTKLFVLYRDNDLFRAYIPQLLESFDIVDKVVIPQGTEFDDALRAEIRESITKAKANGAEFACADYTCLYEFKLYNDWNKYTILDYLFQDQVEKLLKSHPTDDEKKAWFARSLTGGKSVKKIILVTSRIRDHGFWDVGSAADVAEHIAQVVGHVYTDAEKHVTKDLGEAMAFVDDPEALIILDRHCGIKEKFSKDGRWYSAHENWHHKSILFILPFETALGHLVGRPGFDFDYNINDMVAAILKNAPQ